MQITAPQLPALKAIQELRKEVKTRIGKEGGHLNQLMLSRLDVIESTLRQIEPLGNMMNLVNQQTELAVHGFRALSKIQGTLPEGNNEAEADDGSSETKGE